MFDSKQMGHDEAHVRFKADGPRRGPCSIQMGYIFCHKISALNQARDEAYARAARGTDGSFGIA